MKQKDTLLIIDGHNLLFQMFYGMPSRIVNQNGKAIQGVIGFVGALIKIIKQVKPTHLIVLFDGEHENSRTELLPEYKGNRIDYSKVEEDNPFSQLLDVYRALDYMGVRHCETVDVETDDVIASYALTYGGTEDKMAQRIGNVQRNEAKLSIVISSWDSDFFQLINEQVTVLRYRGKCTTICDTKYIWEKFQITPDRYADFKSLVGDNADNIKGAEKVGPKTASALLQQFGSLEEMLVHVEEIEKKHIRESIANDRERLRINYELIKLSEKAKLPFALEELLYEYNDVKTNEVLHGIGIM